MDEEPNPYVRHTDPETSHEAAESIDPHHDSLEALAFLKEMLAKAPNSGAIAQEFYRFMRHKLMWAGLPADQAHRRAESLRRRLSDLRNKYHKISVRTGEDGKVLKREKQQIYYLNER